MFITNKQVVCKTLIEGNEDFNYEDDSGRFEAFWISDLYTSEGK